MSTFARNRKNSAILKSSTAIALVLAAIGGTFAVSPAAAQCTTQAPTSGATVTCDAFALETNPIIAPGSQDVTVNFLPGAILQTATSPAIALGGGATISIDSAFVTDIGSATIPLGALSPLVTTPDDATIELGTTDFVATQAGILDITSVVTVQKAKMADQAMNAITQYIPSFFDPNAGLPTGGPILDEPGTNQVIVSGGAILSGGAAAVRAADDAATRVIVTDGGLIASFANDAPAISMGERSALHVVLGELDATTPSGGTILTVGDGSAGIDAGRDDSAIAVYLLGDGHIVTTGNDAHAIVGPGASSVMAFEARGGLATDGLPMIATFGDNSSGVFMHGTGNSAATLQIRDVYDAAFGPGMQTSGDNSTLFDIDLGANSSASFVGVNSSFGTFGDDSAVVRIAQNGNSDALVFLQNSTLTSTGTGSTLLDLSTTAIGSSITSLVIIGGALANEGDGSAGILLGGGFDSSSQTMFLANSTIATLGDDATAIHLGRHGSSSVTTTFLLDSDISTAGDRSGGLVGEMTGNGSAAEVTLENVSIATLGDDAPALALVGSMNDGSAYAVAIFAGSQFTTAGANSHGVLIGGGGQDSSVFAFGISESTISTAGAAADALRIDVALADDDGVTVIDVEDMAISTAGDGARGIVLGGSATGAMVDSSSSFFIGGSTVETLGDNATGIEIAGVIGGMVNSDLTIVVEDTDIATSGTGSIGLSLGGIAGTLDGSTVSRVVSDVGITTTGDDAIGLLIGGQGPLVGGSVTAFSLTDITVATSGANAHGLVLAAGLNHNIESWTGISITTAGTDSTGFLAMTAPGRTTNLNDIEMAVFTSGAGSTGFLAMAAPDGATTINDLDMTVSTAGAGSTGMDFGMAANFTGVYTDIGASVTTLGDDSPGIVFRETEDGNGSLIMFDARFTIATTGDRSPGYVFGGIGDGPGDSFVGVAGHPVQVTTQGDDSPGVIFNALGNKEDTQEVVFIDLEFTVDTTGDRSPGVIFGANRTDTPNTLISSFQASDIGAFVTTTGDDSVGFFFGPGAMPSGDFTIAAVAIHGDIVTSGDNSHGVIFTQGLSNAQPGQNVQITMTLQGPLSVVTSGDNAHGIVLGDGLGTTRTDMNFVSVLDIGSGWSATTSGVNSHALVISENTTLTLDDANFGATTANGTIVNGTIETFDGFVATGPGGRAIHNEGILFGELTFGTGVVGNISNNGLMESEAGAAGMAATYGDTADIFELQPLGVVIGMVQAGDGNDTFILGGVGSASFDHSLIGTQYLNFEAFVKEDASIWILTGPDSAAPFLPGTITGGTLVVEATLDGFNLVNTAAGRLEGTGGVGDLTNAGAFAPGGMGIASFSVAGDLALQSGGTFEVDIDGMGNADHVAVGGTTSLDGTLSVSLAGFLSEAPTAPTYTIVTSQGPIGGMFDGFTDDLPDIDLTASVFQPGGGDPGRVVLGFTASDEESDKSVYANALYGAANAGRMFADTLIARGRPSASSAFSGSSAFADDGAGRQLAALPATDGAVSDASNIAQAPRSAERRFGFWIAGLGHSIDQDNRNGRTGYDSKGAGVAVGAEAAFGGGDSAGILGVALAWSRDDIDSGASSADLEAWQAGLYAAWRIGALSLAGAVGYGWTETDFRRSVMGGVTAKGDTDGEVLSGSVEIAYDIARSLGLRRDIGLRIAPTAGLDIAHVSQDGFSESGAGILNLKVDSQSDTQVWSTLGVAIGADFRLSGETRLRPEISLGWEHLFSGTPSVDSSLPIATGGFSTKGVAQARDRAAVGAGVAIEFGPTISAHVRYQGSFASGYAGHRGTAGLSFRF